MEDETGTPTSTETKEETVETPEVKEEEHVEEDLDALKARLAKAEEIAENQKRRAEKAEQKAKAVQPETPRGDELNTKDVLALVNAKVSQDDYDEVVKMAKLLGKAVSDTLNDNSVKAILSAREEERRTAQATQTKSPRGVTKTSGDDLLAKAEKTGEVPDTDAAMQEMLRARLARRKN